MKVDRESWSYAEDGSTTGEIFHVVIDGVDFERLNASAMQIGAPTEEMLRLLIENALAGDKAVLSAS